MAGLSNITKNGFNQTSDIYYNNGSVNLPISQVYYENNLIWEKTTVVSPTWYNYTDGSMLMAEYTPSTDITVDEFSMILTTNTLVYNYIVGIYTAAGGAIMTQTGTSGISIIAGDIVETEQSYIHKISFGATGPSLSAGTSYFFTLGERYASYKALTGTGTNSGVVGSVYAWSLTNDPISPAPVATDPTESLYLNVVAL